MESALNLSSRCSLRDNDLTFAIRLLQKLTIQSKESSAPIASELIREDGKSGVPVWEAHFGQDHDKHEARVRETARW
jgi:hypothetical protein